MSFFKWFYPGMKIKRWLVLALLGMILFSHGLLLLVNFAPGYLDHILAWAVQAGFSIHLLYFSLLILGLVIFMLGIWGWMHSILSAVTPGSRNSLVDLVYQHRSLNRGLSVVAIGGGTGLSTLLRGLKVYTSNLVAVVTVSDDGGSSGRLRKELGVLPPGDIRNCLVALADTELLGELLQYRFQEGEGLEGHSFGNLFLVAMTDLTGDFLQGVKASSKVLAVRGKVLPSTLQAITLCAELQDGTIVEGESQVARQGKFIERLFCRPQQPKPLEEIIQAIQEADAIVFGPGSLYTSIMPNFLVSRMKEAIQSSPAVKIFVCNCMTQPGETDDFTASLHLKAFEKQFGRGLFGFALVNTERPSPKVAARYKESGSIFVEPDVAEIKAMGIRPIALPLISAFGVVRHDEKRLSQALVETIMAELYRGGKSLTSLWEEQKPAGQANE